MTSSSVVTFDQLPQITPSHGQAPSLSVHRSDRDGEKRPWLTCTDISDAITPASKKSWKLTKSCLRSEMSRMVDQGIRLAIVALQFGKYDIVMRDVVYTPFEVQGLEQYALDALISAAELLEYDGENDIAHRLEAGSSPKYIDPLCAYVRRQHPSSPVLRHHFCRLPNAFVRISSTSKPLLSKSSPWSSSSIPLATKLFGSFTMRRTSYTRVQPRYVLSTLPTSCV